MPHKQYRHNLNSDSPQRRTDEEWVMALCGKLGDVEQHSAHVELGAYLYTAALNHLLMRQPAIARIAHYSADDLRTIAEDFVQGTLYKIAQGDFKILEKYNGRGRFLAWATQVLRNAIRSELRKRDWHLTYQLNEEAQYSDQQGLNQQSYRPDLIFQSQQLKELVERLLAKFSPKNQTIFQRYIVEGERANVVAKELGISAAGVYTAAHRIREQMSSALTDAGYAY